MNIFGSCLDNTCRGMLCKKCSGNFDKFTLDFIQLNYGLINEINKIGNSNMILRGYNKRITDSIRKLLNILEIFKDLLEPNALMVTNFDIDELLLTFKFPVPHNNAPHFVHFMKKHKPKFCRKNNMRYFTFEQLVKMNNEFKKNNTQRTDIRDKEQTIYYHDVEYLEDTYNFKTNAKFVRYNERDGLSMFEYLSREGVFDYFDQDEDPDLFEFNDAIGEHMYNITRDVDINTGVVYNREYSSEYSILLNYLDLFYCRKCNIERPYYTRVSERLMILSCISSVIYNTFCKPNFIKFIHGIETNVMCLKKFRTTISFKLNEIKKQWGHEPLSFSWKGCKYYYEKLGIRPKILIDANIPEEHYTTRVWNYFSDQICGHPLASHGWFAESLKELLDLNILSN